LTANRVAAVVVAVVLLLTVAIAGAVFALGSSRGNSAASPRTSSTTVTVASDAQLASTALAELSATQGELSNALDRTNREVQQHKISTRTELGQAADAYDQAARRLGRIHSPSAGSAAFDRMRAAYFGYGNGLLMLAIAPLGDAQTVKDIRATLDRRKSELLAAYDALDAKLKALAHP
jgi:hypothetical protein